ncbi:MAG TPA: hypothetical protein PK323_11335 [Bacteroidia bacterium]|nr:hypothetical protein [Bacteroidia bacterium]
MKSKLLKYLDLIILFLCCLLIFSYLVKYVATDINAHIQQIKIINKGLANYPANFLFYFIINLLSGFSNGNIMYFITVVVLTTATTFKYYISKLFIIQYLKSFNKINYKGYAVNIALITMALFFSFAIHDPYSLFVLKKVYLSKFVPIAWHNSTSIVLFPFAILLFWKQLKLFEFESETTLKEILIINVLVLINLLIKPSFIFAYAPVSFFYMIIKFKKRISIKDFFLRLTPYILILIVVIIQYYLIYMQQQGSFYNHKSSVILTTPFKMLAYFIPYHFIPFSLLLSFLFPIVTYLSYNEIINYKPFKYALHLTIVAIIISAFIMEQGPRSSHGNFLWQNIICTYLLFLSSISFLINNFSSKASLSKKDKLILCVLALHVISGILYLAKIWYTLSYY